MKANSKPSIKKYILANPSATINEVIGATGGRRDSVSTMFTILRRLYRDSTVNAAGLRAPYGLPPFTEEMFQQLTTKRPPSKRTKFKRKTTLRVVEKDKAPAEQVQLKLPLKTRVEAIDLIEAQGLGFHLGMVVEYICMASKLGTNDGMRSLELAKVYLDRAIAKNVEPNTSR